MMYGDPTHDSYSDSVICWMDWIVGMMLFMVLGSAWSEKNSHFSVAVWSTLSTGQSSHATSVKDVIGAKLKKRSDLSG